MQFAEQDDLNKNPSENFSSIINNRLDENNGNQGDPLRSTLEIPIISHYNSNMTAKSIEKKKKMSSKPNVQKMKISELLQMDIEEKRKKRKLVIPLN